MAQKLIQLALATSGVALLNGFSAVANAVTLAGFETDTNPNAALSASSLDASITEATLNRGSGLSLNSGSTYNSNNWTIGGNASTATSNGDFLEINFTIASGFSVTDLEVIFFGDRSTTGPSDIDLVFSTDGISFSNTSIQGLDVGESGSQVSTTIDGIFSGNVIFRILGYNATGSGGTFDIENKLQSNQFGLIINGTATTSEIPWETDLATAGALFFGAMLIYRRSRKLI